jgi:hypothetical protein
MQITFGANPRPLSKKPEDIVRSKVEDGIAMDYMLNFGSEPNDEMVRTISDAAQDALDLTKQERRQFPVLSTDWIKRFLSNTQRFLIQRVTGEQQPPVTPEDDEKQALRADVVLSHVRQDEPQFFN